MQATSETMSNKLQELLGGRYGVLARLAGEKRTLAPLPFVDPDAGVYHDLYYPTFINRQQHKCTLQMQVTLW